jgi:hypothetical protein
MLVLGGSLLPDLRENRLRHSEPGLSQFSNRVIENDEAGLIGFIEHGERDGNLQPSEKCFLPSRLLIDEHHVGMHLGCERDRLEPGDASALPIQRAESEFVYIARPGGQSARSEQGN